MHVLSYIVMGLGVVFMLFGVVGIFQAKKDFYYRILVACKIDTVGFLTLAIGVAIRQGFSFFTGKLFLIVIIMMVLNPLVAHIMVRSAYKGGYVPACDIAAGTAEQSAAPQRSEEAERGLTPRVAAGLGAEPHLKEDES